MPVIQRNGNQISFLKGSGVLLRNSVIVRPQEVSGGDIGSNRIIGIITPPPKIVPLAVPPPVVFQGGEILKAISFNKNKNSVKRDNIKFVY